MVKERRYGPLECAYAAPIAEALVQNPKFRDWVIGHTKFAPVARHSRLLHEEMKAARKASTWWRSHFTESCRCEGCSGQETDLLAIFETVEGQRVALHFEVKQPTDRFTPGGRQAANYQLRAKCWITKPPRSVLSHERAATVLLCNEHGLAKFAEDVAHFDAVITFEQIRLNFPAIGIPESDKIPS